MNKFALYGAAGVALFAAGMFIGPSLQPTTPAEASAVAKVERGKHLVGLSLCTDCHTPGYLRGVPDVARYLGGSETGFEMEGAGVFHGPNLTPDPETGLGKWTEEMFMAALRTGRHEGKGRPILPPMPWPMIRNLTDADLRGIFAYLQSLPPVKNRVPQPVDPPEGGR